jgi:hypothetical protein
LSRIRLVDGDNDYFMFGGSGHHVNGAVVRPSEQQAAGVGLILGIILDDLSVSNDLSDVLFANVPFDHAMEGMDAVDEGEGGIRQGRSPFDEAFGGVLFGFGRWSFVAWHRAYLGGMGRRRDCTQGVAGKLLNECGKSGERTHPMQIPHRVGQPAKSGPGEPGPYKGKRAGPPQEGRYGSQRYNGECGEKSGPTLCGRRIG